MKKIVKDYSWIHLGIAICGHCCFFVGSVFFLYEPLKQAGTWLFIVGAGGMLVGKIGSAVIEAEYSQST